VRAVREVLPADGRIVICWRDAGGDAYSADDAVPAALVARALSMLGTKGRARDADILDHWTTEQGTEIVLAAQNASGVVSPMRDVWQAMARRTIAASLEAWQSRNRIATLEKSERLQQALYEIA